MYPEYVEVKGKKYKITAKYIKEKAKGKVKIKK